MRVFKRLREILTMGENLRRIKTGRKKSNFVQTDEGIETSPFYVTQEELKTEESQEEERKGKIELYIIVDSRAARSTMSLRQWNLSRE